jgi:hypothetical protein
LIKDQRVAFLFVGVTNTVVGTLWFVIFQFLLEAKLGYIVVLLCAQTDPEAFFPEKGGSTREAKRICQGCEVRDACLEYALAHDERFGIWGGLSERERRRIKRGII